MLHPECSLALAHWPGLVGLNEEPNIWENRKKLKTGYVGFGSLFCGAILGTAGAKQPFWPLLTPCQEHP